MHGCKGVCQTLVCKLEAKLKDETSKVVIMCARMCKNLLCKHVLTAADCFLAVYVINFSEM